MLQLGNGLYFALETFGELRVVKKFARQDFDRHLTVKAGIERVVDGCHSSTPQFPFDLVPSDIFYFHKASITSQLTVEKI